jgi:hypothetical protein
MESDGSAKCNALDTHGLSGMFNLTPILKASQSQLADFESRPGPISPVFKSFS